MKFLFAPWRWSFISNADKLKKCVFCEAQKEGPDKSLICYRGKNYFVILNKYPYTSGHLMIVPFEHLNSPKDIDPQYSTEMWDILNKSLDILQKNFNPDGFNVGMNIGEAAGAGVRDHFHLHIVPRWKGDSNFMGVTGNTKVVSYDINIVFDIIKKGFDQ
ncbi:MAG: HIT domain-containing protein [Acidobacteriota bacterium]